MKDSFGTDLRVWNGQGSDAYIWMDVSDLDDRAMVVGLSPILARRLASQLLDAADRLDPIVLPGGRHKR